MTAHPNPEAEKDIRKRLRHSATINYRERN